jgi:multiple sugar transport system permease protein
MSTRKPPIQDPPPRDDGRDPTAAGYVPPRPTAGTAASPIMAAGYGKPARRGKPPDRWAGGRPIGRYMLTRGWVHLLLIAGAALFLFPFLWMLSTSVKTDEELINPTAPPGIPRFVGESPYVRAHPAPQRPHYVQAEQWERIEPMLRQEAEAAVAAALRHMRAGIADADAHQQAAADLIIERLVARIPRRLWELDEAEVLRVFRQVLTPGEVAAALDDRLARFELRQVQVRTLDARIFNITDGAEMADQWRVESGPGQLLPADSAATWLAYRFASPGSEPIVLRYEFPFPADPQDLHKLIISLRGDDSWHRVDATLDLGGVRWESQRTTYIAQHRPSSIVLQPPTFDDETFKARTWIPLRGAGVSPHQPNLAILRVIISPSGTAQAIYGKAQRNYSRAFLSVPFWLYVFNSLLLVGLTMGGALFSSAFVAYAFARLNWPGRSVAFVVLLATMMLPAQVTMIPSFLIWRELGWYNTLNPMWVPAWFGGAFFIFLMTQHMKTIPKDLEEAARIDGLNAVQTWWYIFVPLVKPSLAAIAIMTFMGAWNEFMGPLIYLRDQHKFPLSLGLFGINLDYGGDWTMIMAGNMLMTLPVIIIFFIFQRYFIQGMTMTGMKG